MNKLVYNGKEYPIDSIPTIELDCNYIEGNCSYISKIKNESFTFTFNVDEKSKKEIEKMFNKYGPEKKVVAEKENWYCEHTREGGYIYHKYNPSMVRASKLVAIKKNKGSEMFEEHYNYPMRSFNAYKQHAN